MKYLGKIAVLGAVLALSASAFAAPVTGSISIAGLDTYNATGITFTPTTGIVLAGTGSLAAYSGSTAGLTSFNFASADGTILFFSPQPIGSATMGFVISGPVTVVHDDSTFLNVIGNGTFYELGLDPTAGTFSLTSTANTIISFTLDSTVPTPEPNSLMLMGTGLVSAAGMIMRRRRAIA